MAQRFIGHDRPEVGAADADVDDVPDRLAGVPLPLARADAVGEGGHPVEDGVHLRDDVDAVDDERLPSWHAQRDVEDGAVLGDVDAVAAEHRLGPLAQAGLLGELQEEAERLVGDAVLRVVEVQASPLRRQPLAARRVVGEQVAQVEVAYLRVVLLQRLPGGTSPQGRRRW